MEKPKRTDLHSIRHWPTELFDYFVEKCSEDVPCETGVFGAFMKVSLLNNGPVTILLEKEFEE